MSWQLDIEFGGLCLFVRSRVHDAMFVLMPHSPVGIAQHQPLVQLPDLKYRSLLGVDADLSFYATAPGDPVLQKGLAPVSWIAGRGSKVPVDGAWLVAPLDANGPVAARIKLPSGITVKRVGHGASLEPENLPALAGKYVGRCQTTLEVADAVRSIDIGNYRISRPAVGEYTSIAFINATHADLTCRCQREHPKGQVVEHFSAYYSLLDQQSLPGPAPRMLVGEAVAADGGCEECHKAHPTRVIDLRDPISIRFVDPYFCTVGYGCEDGDPTCT